MLVPVTEIADVWMRIRRGEGDDEDATAPVLIFASAMDCDALAASRTLTFLLKVDVIPYTLLPVAGFDHMKEQFASQMKSHRPRAVICVNCGACANLVNILRVGDYGSLGSLPIFVLDSHRPYHLSNLESPVVHLLDDQIRTSRQFPLAGYEDDYGYVDQASDDSSSDEDDERDETSDVDSFLEEDEHSFQESERSAAESDSEDDFNASDRGRKRRRSTNEGSRGSRRRKDTTQDHTDARRASLDYYKYAHRGEPSALIAHLLANDLNKATTETLWGAILGVTDQFYLQRVTKDRYEDQVQALKIELSRFFPALNNFDDDEAFSHEFSKDQYIRPNEELRLDLLRHWSLLSSLQSSAYVCTKLMSWKQAGRNRILEFLAKLGIPKAEAAQMWKFMKDDSKDALQGVSKVIDEFGLFDLQYEGFIRVLKGHQGFASAADFVCAVNAILELHGLFSTIHAQGCIDLNQVDRRFWLACDAVSGNDLDALFHGVELAKKAQEILVSEAHQILERKKIIPSGSFRYVFLRDSQQKAFLVHPLVLSRLALFILDALRCSGVQTKPIVILAPNEELRRWVTVAQTGRGLPNNFGHKFRLAASKIQATITLDGFESSVIEIKFGQETEFIRYLHDILTDA